MDNWIVENLGWTLLHSLWQIGFVALILFVVLQILRDFSANLRYLLSVSALSLSLILPLLTFIYFSSEMKQPQPKIQNVSPLSKQAPIQETKRQIISENIDVPPIISAENSVSSPPSNIRQMPILVGFWLIGVLFFSVRLLGGIWTIHRYKTKEVSIVETHWQTKFDELCKHLNIRQKVRFLQSKKVEIPMVIGWLKPVVLVPASVFLQVSPKELETILIHELIHIKRRDYLVNFLQSLVEILFFYHPFVWWISAKIRQEREFAVDEFLSQIFETERIIYAKALASLEEIRTIPTTNLVMAANGGNLMKRIENILNGNKKINSKNVSIWSAVFAVTFVLGVTAGFYWLKTSEINKSKKGRKVAVVFSDFSPNISKSKSVQHILELQKKYEIPATWVLESELIKELEQTGETEKFFLQAHQNRSNFILSVPNINYTIFVNGDDEYLALWQKRIQYIDEIMTKNGDKLKYWTTSANQIPQQMEDYIAQQGLRPTKLPKPDDLKFHLSYEKDCTITEKRMSCEETSAEKRKEIREKYLQYISEIFEFNENYSQEKFGLETPQVLSLWARDLTNDVADELFQMLQNKGYEFVPLEEVTSNEAYKLLESSKDRELFGKKWKILDKYLPRAVPLSSSIFEIDKLSKADENRKKVFKVEVSVKDLKIKEK